MDSNYWLQRWQDGRTGWHHEEVMPLLAQHWPALAVPLGTRVLVALAGKTLDMLWLSRQGLHVVGVEVAPIAVESFLAENSLQADVRSSPEGPRYTVTNAPGAGIEIINGDVFGVDAATLGGCGAFYDRAATIALPAPIRERLAREVYARLPAGSRGLLITLDYPPQEMDGPPFPVDDAEAHRLFDPHWQVEQLERRDILASQPHFAEQGVTALHTAVYRLQRKTG